MIDRLPPSLIDPASGTAEASTRTAAWLATLLCSHIEVEGLEVIASGGGAVTVRVTVREQLEQKAWTSSGTASGDSLAAAAGAAVVEAVGATGGMLAAAVRRLILVGSIQQAVFSTAVMGTRLAGADGPGRRGARELMDLARIPPPGHVIEVEDPPLCWRSVNLGVATLAVVGPAVHAPAIDRWLQTLLALDEEGRKWL